MTYNVRYFGHAFPFRGFASSRRVLNAIASRIATLEDPPDVVCLQEVEARSLRSFFSHTREAQTSTQLEEFHAALDRALRKTANTVGYQAYYFPAHVYAFRGSVLYSTGLAMLVRKGIRVKSHNADAPYDVTHRRSDLVSELKQSRIAAHIVLEPRPGILMDLFNTHLSLPAFFPNNFYRLMRMMGSGENQIEEVQNLTHLVSLRAQSGRIVLLGDFNALPGSPSYQLVTQVLDDAFARFNGLSQSELCSWSTAGFLHSRMRLDHVLSKGALRWLDFEDTDKFGTVGGLCEGLSDHVPIIGRVELLAGR